MLQKNAIWALIICFAYVALADCSQSAREHYSDAGTNASSAAKDTGQAMASDAKATEHAISDAIDTASISHTQLSGKIEAAIHAAPDIYVANLVAKTPGKKIILTGRVSAEDQRLRAEDIAHAVAGPGYIVDDQLKVKGQL